MIVYLIRHAQSEANAKKGEHQQHVDPVSPLTDLGVQQAKELGAFLRSDVFDKIGSFTSVYMSPALRVQQTVEAVEVYPALSYIELMEQRPGLFEGLSLNQIYRDYPKEGALYAKYDNQKQKFYAPIPGGESQFDVYIRVQNWVRSILLPDRQHYGHIAIFSHGVVLGCLEAILTNTDPNKMNVRGYQRNASVRCFEQGTIKEIYNGII